MIVNTKTFLFLLILLIVNSCSQKLPYGDPLEKPTDILKNQSSFADYWYEAMDLSTNFVGLDPFSKQISKEAFLQQVATGKYLPVRLLAGSASKFYYRLYKLDAAVDPYISSMLRSIGSVAYKDFKWEGLPLPAINFTDLNGKKYNSDFIKGKTLVLDFWFIGCTSCVREFPKLNELRNNYSNRNDVLFAAIAPDNENTLRKFLRKTDFKFDIISDTTSYLVKTLAIQSFPTQVVVKDGKVMKILDDGYHGFADLELFLKKEVLRHN